MAGSFMCHSKMNKEREMHNIHVNRSRHDVEEVMSMSDFDDDKIRSNYVKIERGYDGGMCHVP